MSRGPRDRTGSRGRWPAAARAHRQPPGETAVRGRLPEPAAVLDRVRIPAAFSARSPRHRRDLASTVRNKLAGQTAEDRRVETAQAGPRRRLLRPAGRGRSRPGAPPPGQPEIARLRRRLRQHPCHACPDRDDHARQAERYARLEREVQQLEAAVAGRSHVIARTFQRVCAVLGRLGYLEGDTVTPDGRRLADLYTELDLLAAESPAARSLGWPGPGRPRGVRVGADLRGT